MNLYLHAFGQRYDLPIPLALYLYAAGGVVVVSFVMVTLFLGDRTGERAISYPRLRALILPALGRSRVVRAITGGIGVLGLLTVIVTGLFGSQNALYNPAQYLTWIYFWAGLVIVCGLVGNVWTLLNPWTALYDLATLGRRRAPLAKLPDGIGIWPAAVVYLLFALFELASGAANRPALVASLAIVYSAVTLAGMFVFGRDQWLRSCEGFSVLFSVIGRFGPIETQRDEEGRLQGVWLRPWGTGLLQPQRPGRDWVAFVILTLSSLAFDGIIAPTPAWVTFDTALTPWVQGLGGLGEPVIRTLGLLLLASAFLLIFVAFARLMLYLGGGRRDELAVVTVFAFTLVPIALVYNAAHNYSYLTVQSQYLFQLLGDPLQRGAPPVLQASFVLAGASTVWFMQIVLIVTGHVIAVLLAHMRAGEQFRTARLALVSQYPMLLLMVLYTMTSLWILAQPITRGG